MVLLLEVVTGSHLYGLAGPDSDVDLMRVVDRYEGEDPRFAVKADYIEQFTEDKFDVTVCDLPTFLRRALAGRPQFVEVMFADVARIDHLAGLRAAFSPEPWAMFEVYRRTAVRFADLGALRQVRHAYRLYLNWVEFVERGRFNPTLDDVAKARLTELVQQRPDVLTLFDATVVRA